jgi:hypothetical protein
MTVQHLADQLTLGALLDELRRTAGLYDLLEHWQQGEFHHDTVLRVDPERAGIPGPILVVATNCNGGVKEVLCFGQMPDRYALWHRRCPDSAEFSGELPEILASSKTLHWFDPCNLLKADARSEYRAEFRERQSGGGWKMQECGVASCGSPDDEDSV